jgi:alkylhydroperoxidase family enzyme
LLQREAAGAAGRALPEGWGEALVESVLRDLEGSALPEKEKVLLRFVDRVNHDSPRITAEDMQPLYQAGWTDEAIYYAITVCALFNFYNRWIDASGVHALSDETHRQGGIRSANAGYVRK